MIRNFYMRHQKETIFCGVLDKMRSIVETDVSITLVGSLIRLTIWYKLLKEIILFAYISAGDLPELQFKSPLSFLYIQYRI